MTIKDLLNPDLWFDVSKQSVRLIEESPDSKLKEVIIKDLPQNIWAFTLDKRKKTKAKIAEEIRNQLLNKNTGFINKGCDGVLMAFGDGSLDIIFCELKSTRPTPQDYEYQLINAKIFVNYLIEILQTIFLNHFQIQNVKYVVFYFKEGLESKETPRPRITSDRPKEIKIMQYFPDEEVIKISFAKSHRNQISWKEIY